MTHKQISIIRTFAHVILMGLGTALNVNLFIQFSKYPAIQVLFGAMATAFELIKLYLFMLAKFHFHEHGFKKIAAGLIEFVLYLGLAFVSMVASLGFTLTSIEQQSFTANIQNRNIDRQVITQDINNIEKQIQSKLDQQAGLPADYITASDRFTQQIKELQAQRQDLLDKLNSLPKDQITQTSDMFSLLGSMVNLSGKNTMFYMMLLLVILLEFTIAITAEDIKKEGPKLIEDKGTIYKYVNELFNTTTAKLNTDERISEATGISLDQCKKYKKLLTSVTYKGTALINSGRGGSTANFNKENLLKILTYHMNVRNKEVV